MFTFSIGGIDDDIVGSDGDDGVSQVVAGKEPADDGNGLLIASGSLSIDQDDAVHAMDLFLEWPNSYIGPSFVDLLNMSVEKLWWNFVLHDKLINYIKVIALKRVIKLPL